MDEPVVYGTSVDSLVEVTAICQIGPVDLNVVYCLLFFFNHTYITGLDV